MTEAEARTKRCCGQCCGLTMTIDAPEERTPTQKDKSDER